MTMGGPRGPTCCLALFAMLSCFRPGAAGAFDLTPSKSSTVRIVCSTNGAYYTGSGFVLGMDTLTYVATNQHVAQCARKGEQQALYVVQSQRTGVPARIVWADPRTDLAILSVPGSLGRPAVTLADTSGLAAGEPITVIGFPAAADKLVQSDEIAAPSVTRGFISLVVTGVNGVHYFQHDAKTLPGNSGGPAFNDAGEVIGIVSMNAVAMVSSAVDGRVAVSQVNTGLGAAVDVSELIPHLQTYVVPYEIGSTAAGMSATMVLLVVVLILLLSAGAILVATSSGRAVLSGDTTVFSASRTEARAARLRVLSGTLAGMEAPILDRVILGRDPARAHVVFPESDSSVSRRHCEIVFDSFGAQFEVRDLGSRNGTYVSRGAEAPRRLSPEVAERLDPGDKVLVGSPRNSLVLELA
jgi:hypothetical protein